MQYFGKDGPGGEKTEPATPKKLQDARKEGQVAKSKEITSALGLIAFFIILKVAVGFIGTEFLETFSAVYVKIPEYVGKAGTFNPQSVGNLTANMLLRILVIVAPLFCAGFLVAFIGEVIQVKWQPTFKPLMPKFNKMNPIKGLKNIISGKSLFELLKAVLKIGVIIYVAYSTLKKEIGFIYLLYEIPLQLAIAEIGDIAFNLGLKISLVYLVISLGDYLYQKYKFSEDMKMTKQEVKDEYKNTEGNPEIKGRQKSRMREASQRRMMQDLPKADVVITNPTHLAVALRYKAEEFRAPVVLAKGEDFLAQKIKEVAKENKIEIVENKPLARMLYHNVEIGEEIPPELYQAVAEVLALVYNLKNS